MAANEASARDVAEWMVARLRRNDFLDQETAVSEIHAQFGGDFTYTNENGNPAIASKVLREFLKLSKADIVWVRSERMWRIRTPSDAPGRQQD
jgi:hypothetical protein